VTPRKQPQRWTTQQVADHLGYKGTNAANIAATQMRRWGVKPVSREVGKHGQYLWDPAQIRTAVAQHRPTDSMEGTP
jgi:hypothetical protein